MCTNRGYVYVRLHVAHCGPVDGLLQVLQVQQLLVMAHVALQLLCTGEQPGNSPSHDDITLYLLQCNYKAFNNNNMTM